MRKFLVLTLTVASIFALCAVALVWQGFVFLQVWEWYFLSLGFPAVTLQQTIMLCMVVSFLANQYRPSEGKYKASEVFAHEFVGPALVLFVAWFML